ncbi:hypothetical protein WBP06_18275 (plasmid) [Novosphingobium sp. BL-8H]|uniref:hypothetical protein n=1 Tax=Novosphingobium sp. BL-8H TaxID=3127640 RepID=UPI003756E5FF
MTRKSQSYTKAAAPLYDAQGRQALAIYDLSEDDSPWFRYHRYYWKKPNEPKCEVAPLVMGKIAPRGHPAYHYEVLLPDDAPGRYKAIEDLLGNYDRALPPHEKTAFAQFTIDHEPEESWITTGELVRSWALEQFVEPHGLAVVIVHHIPELSGSGNDPHHHVIVFPRRLTSNGFGMHVLGVADDEGYLGAHVSWHASIEPGDVFEAIIDDIDTPAN